MYASSNINENEREELSRHTFCIQWPKKGLYKTPEQTSIKHNTYTMHKQYTIKQQAYKLIASFYETKTNIAHQWSKSR
jgi:hypothetical protein